MFLECFKRWFVRGYRGNCWWAKDPDRHKETWWWNDDVGNSVSGKHKLWENWHQENKQREVSRIKEKG